MDRVLITGGAGSLGRELIREFMKHPLKELIIYDNDEFGLYQVKEDFKVIKCILGDMRDKDRLQIDTDFIIHAAALKHVPLCEENPEEAVKTNIEGTINLIETAKCPILGISTDKAVNPINVYGATKMIMERLLLSKRHSIVRFGNFWGSRGSVIPKWQSQDVIEITDPDMSRYWIKLNEAAKFVYKCMKMTKGGEIFIPKMEELTLVQLLEKVAPKSEYRVIGNRGCEKKREELFSKHEKVDEAEDYYVVRR